MLVTFNLIYSGKMHLFTAGVSYLSTHLKGQVDIESLFLTLWY